MPIHEKSLIRPENLTTHDNLVIDGVNVSGHWSTFITPRVVTDYNERLEEEVAAMPGGDKIHRCFQCGSCTNACTINAIEPRFNPRYWIYLIRMGYESELLRDKDIIWQCISCHKCTHICPRDVEPEGVMKATALWLEAKGFTPPSPSHIFDGEFSRQVIERGKIEDTEVLHKFLVKTKQPLMQDWLVQIARNIAMRLPFKWGLKMAWAQVFKPRTRGWAKSRAAIEDYIHEQHGIRTAVLTRSAGPAADEDLRQRARADAEAIESVIVRWCATNNVDCEAVRPGSMQAHDNEGTVYRVDAAGWPRLRDARFDSRAGAAIETRERELVVTYAIGRAQGWPHARFSAAQPKQRETV